MTELDTVVALATPRMTSALAVVRLSGAKTLDILENLQSKRREDILPNTAFYANLYRDVRTKKDPIDQAVVTFFKGPKSYTGEDTAEFSLHGSPLIADALVEACVLWGARPAQRGEFSLKAFLNGKLGLLEAEGVNELIHAESTLARTLALRAVKGDAKKQIESIEETLLLAIGEAEYLLEDDYSDHSDFDGVLSKVVEEKLQPLVERIEGLEEKAKRALKAYEGIRAVLVGKPNVGKSTLLNALLGEEKAIVTPIPGTTRDLVEGDVEISGISFHLTDTAGLHQTDDAVEKIGVKKALEAIRRADLVLWLSPDRFDEKDLPKNLLSSKAVLKIGTKSDLKRAARADVWISASKGDLSNLKERLFQAVSHGFEKASDSFMTERDLSFLIRVKEAVKKGVEALRERGLVDAFSDELRKGVSLSNEMLGKDMRSTQEDVERTIFSRFCLGK